MSLRNGRYTAGEERSQHHLRGAVLMPAHNEADTVAEITSELMVCPDLDVVVIDDGSTDSTAECARAVGATVLTLSSQLGAWGAMQTGFRYAVASGYDFVITMDADGQHLADYVPTLLAPLREGDADVVIGACMERGSWLRRVAWAYFQTLTGLGIEDLTSGFRAYDRRAMVVLCGSEATLLEYQDVGVLFLLRRAGSRIVEVKVPMGERRAGHSRVFRTWFRVAQYMLGTTILCLAKFGAGRKNATTAEQRGGKIF